MKYYILWHTICNSAFPLPIELLVNSSMQTIGFEFSESELIPVVTLPMESSKYLPARNYLSYFPLSHENIRVIKIVC